VIELAVQRERAEEGSVPSTRRPTRPSTGWALHPKLVPHMLEEYQFKQGLRGVEQRGMTLVMDALSRNAPQHS
jgi:hypothetical protein